MQKNIEFLINFKRLKIVAPLHKNASELYIKSTASGESKYLKTQRGNDARALQWFNLPANLACV